jgi:sporulation-control protein spo0M
MKDNEIQKVEVFICDCSSPEHQFVTTYFKDDDDIDCIYFNVRLNATYGFFKRVWNALGYVFKKDEAEYVEVLLDINESKGLKKFLEEGIAEKEKAFAARFEK